MRAGLLRVNGARAMEEPPFSIRAAVAADWPGISAQLTASALPLGGAREHLDGFLVAEAGGALVGVIGLERYADGVLLRSACVNDAWRGRCVGEALVRAILARAESAGDPAVFLLTETAEGWFPRFGFVRVTREDVPVSVKASVEFTTACPASAVVMRRPLAPAS